MVSAGVGNKKALGVDRNPNPWSDIPLADVVGRCKTVPLDYDLLTTARSLGVSLGD